MRRVQMLLLTAVALLTAATASSCGSYMPVLSADETLVLRQNERWQLRLVLVLSSEAALVRTQIQDTFTQLVAQAKAKGVEASWQNLPGQSGDSNLSYALDFSGTGYDKLNELMFSSQQAVYASPGVADQAEFRLSPGMVGLAATSPQSTFTLTANKIIDTNGSRVDGKTVRWVNPTTTMTATVSVAPELTWLWISLLVAGAVGLILAALGLSGKLRMPARQTATAPVYGGPVLPVSVRYCTQCGTANPLEARFCACCGMQLPT